MYRYFLFYCPYYYPDGGMEDCILKTNNLDDIEPFLRTTYKDDHYLCTISYYDALEDKTFYACLEEYENEDHMTRWRILGWEENTK